jgi:hypothetical protein
MRERSLAGEEGARAGRRRGGQPEGLFREELGEPLHGPAGFVRPGLAHGEEGQPACDVEGDRVRRPAGRADGEDRPREAALLAAVPAHEDRYVRPRVDQEEGQRRRGREGAGPAVAIEDLANGPLEGPHRGLTNLRGNRRLEARDDLSPNRLLFSPGWA